MSAFKKFIARLFNIRPEDLQEEPHKLAQSPEELEKKIQEQVNRQVKEQLQQMLHEVVIPELQKSVQQPPPKSRLDITSKDESVERTQPVVVKPLETSLEKPIESVTSTETSFNEEFPLLEDVQENIEPQFILTAEELVENQEAEFVVEEIIPTPPLEEDEEILPLEESFPEEEILPLEELEAAAERTHEVQLQPVEGKEIRIGVDFGTTTTAVSIKVGNQKPEALPIGEDGITRYIPSVVYFQPGSGDLAGRAIVGEEAERFSDQAKVIRSIKRCIGCPEINCRGNSKKDSAQLPFAWCKEDGIVHLSSNEVIEPVQVAYLIVREALRRAIKLVRERWQIDLTMERICFLPINMGCGASFDLTQRGMILKIAMELGFENAKLDNVVEEPILAGFAFSRFVENPVGRALIYDFGGGTFDVAVLDVDRFNDKLRVTVVSTAGENWLGGDDIDNLVYRYFLETAAQEIHYPVDVVEDMMGSIDRSRLRVLARNAKEFLSVNEQYSDSILSTNLGPLNLLLTREDLERIISSQRIIERSFEAARRACRLAFAYDCARESGNVDGSVVSKHELKDAARFIDRVILVGGVTKIPMIRRELVKLFGESKIVQESIIEPVSAVSIGAAYELDPDHYSIAYPPYEICLEYKLVGSEITLTKTVLQPYEFLDFHKLWVTNSSAIYLKFLPFMEPSESVRLSYRKAGTAEQLTLIKNIGKLPAGEFRFSISMEGMMRLEKGGQNAPAVVEVDYPVIHPIQKAIMMERDRRRKLALEEEAKKFGSYEDDVKKMMTEN